MALRGPVIVPGIVMADGLAFCATQDWGVVVGVAGSVPHGALAPDTPICALRPHVTSAVTDYLGVESAWVLRRACEDEFPSDSRRQDLRVRLWGCECLLFPLTPHLAFISATNPIINFITLPGGSISGYCDSCPVLSWPHQRHHSRGPRPAVIARIVATAADPRDGMVGHHVNTELARGACGGRLQGVEALHVQGVCSFPRRVLSVLLFVH